MHCTHSGRTTDHRAVQPPRAPHRGMLVLRPFRSTSAAYQYGPAAIHTDRRRRRMRDAAGRCRATAAPRLSSRLATPSSLATLSIRRRGAGLRAYLRPGLRRLLRASAEQGSLALRPPARLQAAARLPLRVADGRCDTPLHVTCHMSTCHTCHTQGAPRVSQRCAVQAWGRRQRKPTRGSS